MDPVDADVAVVGAGPSGLIAARESSKRGVSVLVLEEHEEIGSPCHCAGLLSISGLSSIGVPGSGPYVLNRVRGAHFFSPSNLSFTLEWNKPIACVVDRRLLDLFLARQASRSGSLIKLKSRVRCARWGGDRWILNVDEMGKFGARLLIDAEGATPIIPGMAGLEALDRGKLLRGLHADIYGLEMDPDFIEVHLSRSLAPNFFAWVIPLDEEVARVGLACEGPDVKSRLFRFMEKRFRMRFAGGLKILKYYSGLVVTCGPIKRTYGDGLLIVGDAAGQTKPITGGGVVFGGICASIAGRVASEAIKRGNVGEGSLKTYEDEWRSRIGREIRMAALIRKILNNLSDRDLDKIFSAIIREGVPEEIVRSGDMDFQAATLIRALGWRIPRFLPAILKSLLSNLLSVSG